MSEEFLFIVTVAYLDNNQLQLSQRHVWATDLNQESIKDAATTMLDRVPQNTKSNTQTLFTIIPEAVKNKNTASLPQ